MYDKEYADMVIKMVKSHERTFREQMAERRRASAPLNATAPSDDQFASWFEMKAAENPNWVLALPFVDGGKDLLQKYERARGVADGL